VHPTSDEGLARAHLQAQGQAVPDPGQQTPSPVDAQVLAQLVRDIAAARERGLSVYQIRKRLGDGLPLDAPEGAWAAHKRAAVTPANAKSVTVRGQFFKGYQSACHHFGLPPKRVRRVSQQKGWELGATLEWCLQEA